MKRTLVIATAIVLAVSITPAVSAATKEPVKNCKKTTSKSHASPSIAQPKTIAKVLPTTFTFITNCGNIVVETVGDKAPQTLTALATLASKGFYNSTLCHRLTTQGLYVLQCGDPSGTGSGGPAYTAPDENLPKLSANSYPAGSVAMANSGPNTNGSQFFIVYADNSKLGPNYTLWGKVVKGLEIVKAVAALGSNNSNDIGDGQPNQPITIEKAISR
jgi:peptidyl-prolyl cis-trans isomerase B (cyclophilin B)